MNNYKTRMLRMPVGKTKHLKPSALDQHGKPTAMPSSVTYLSSNVAIATVDASGLVTAVSAGSCTITITCGALSCTKEVWVDAAPPAPVPYSPVATSLKV